ncbi:MAG: DHH family phosphoesterase [Solobacterium sp.]|nr:DHH family phosphoesterase [Solobacterium sp.]
MKWEIITPDEREICERYHTGRLSGKLLAASGLGDEDIRTLLDDSYHVVTSGAECVRRCAEELVKAKTSGLKVFIAGDYDADGICSTAIMKRTLDRLRITNGYYIPDRLKEGYGLSAATVRAAHAKGYAMIITVDNGVRAHEAIACAHSLGMKIIVTDHHVIDEEVDADLLVHPCLMEEDYKYLCGAGVALQISRTLIGEDDEMTALAACASIGDVMPLWRQTREIVKAGMAVLRTGRPRPLAKLLTPGSAVSETTIAFQIVPKLNSVGRMSHISNVNTVVRYLLSTDEKVQTDYCIQLGRINDLRRELSVKETADAARLDRGEKFAVLYDPSFHEGIVGLAAGKLADEFRRPVLVMAKGEGIYKGSGRAPEGFDMFSFFADFDYLSAFGGHEAAVGLSVAEGDLERFLQDVREKMERTDFVYQEPCEKAVLITERMLNFDDVSDLERLSPYPKDLIRPYFALRGEYRKVYESDKLARYAIAANTEAALFKRKGLPCPDTAHVLIGRPSVNRWRNSVKIQLEIEEIS